MNRTRRRARFLGVLGLSLALSQLVLLDGRPSHAQAEDAETRETLETVVFDEVAVTATRRPEELQSIPISVTTLSGEEIQEQQVKTLADLQAQVPNLYLATSSRSHSPFIFIRGLGLNDFNQIAQGSVGIYQDEIYQNSTAAQLSQLFDLERVEVLRGPQGTLYGRNTTGGAINLVTRKPTGETDFTLRATLGSDDLQELELATGGATSEHAAARFAGVINRQGGIMTNSATGERISDTDNWAVRGLLEVQPGEGQTWLLAVSASGVDEEARSWEDSPANLARWDVGVPWEVEVTDPGFDQVDVFGATATGNFELSGFNLTSVTGYLASQRRTTTDLDLRVADVLTQFRGSDAEQWSQELRLTSSGPGRAAWLVGLYFFQEDLEATTDLAANNLFGFLTFFSENDFFQRDRAAALFGHGSYGLTERLSLLGGLRWTWEEKEFRNAQEGFFGAPLALGQGTDSWTEPTANIGLQDVVSDHLMWYGKYNHGFRSGGWNAGGNIGDPSFGPEFVDSLEGGLKWRWATGRLHLAAFHSEYRELQVLTRVVRDGVPQQILTNAAKAEISGAEAEILWRPKSSILLTTGLAWLDTRFAEFVDTEGIDRRGNRLIGSPEFSWNGTAHYSFGLAGGGELVAGVDWSFTDKVYFDFANSERLAQEGPWLMGARVGLSSPSRKLEVAIWGRNITGEVYTTRALPLPALAIDLIMLGNPETYGLSFTLRR